VPPSRANIDRQATALPTIPFVVLVRMRLEILILIVSLFVKQPSGAKRVRRSCGHHFRRSFVE